MWILVGRPCGRAVHDGDALAHARKHVVRAGEPSESCVKALYAIGIVPYWPDHGLRACADVVYRQENDWYCRENDWYSRDYEPHGPDYDVRTLEDVVSRVRNASGAPACRLTGPAIA